MKIVKLIKMGRLHSSVPYQQLAASHLAQQVPKQFKYLCRKDFHRDFCIVSWFALTSGN